MVVISNFKLGRNMICLKVGHRVIPDVRLC